MFGLQALRDRVEPAKASLILQLELRISEGAGAFRPLKTGQKKMAFRWDETAGLAQQH
jgi:hypothetical protein